jgi:hypothetical protein
MGLTFFLAMIGWIIFRAESLSQVGGYFEAMVSNQFIDFSMLYGKKAVIFAAVMLFVEWLQREKEHALQFPEIKVFKPAVVRWGVYFLLTIIILGVHGSSQTFIYFQF